MFFLISVSDVSLLVYKNAFHFWVLTLYPAVLPKSFIRSSSFLVESIGFSMYTIMSSANNESFVSSFQIWIPYISFCCLIAVPRTSNTMLNRSGERGHPCLVPDLSGKALSFCLLSMMLAVGLSYMAFIMLRNAPSIPTLLSVFYHKRVLYLIKCFFCISWYDHVIFVFPVVCVVCYVYWFANIVPSLHPWDESHLVMVYDLFNVLLDVVWSYFVENFSVYVLQQYCPEVFFLRCVFIWFWD